MTLVTNCLILKQPIKKAERDGVGLPFIPGKEDDTPENKKFKERVRMFQYLVTANEGDNNKEIIWGQRIDADVTNGERRRTHVCRIVW